MMRNLEIVQRHRNLRERPFGSRGIDPSVIDEQIEKEERRIMKRRRLCSGCNTYTSVSGTCFC
jgi:hypothetical protein